MEQKKKLAQQKKPAQTYASINDTLCHGDDVVELKLVAERFDGGKRDILDLGDLFVLLGDLLPLREVIAPCNLRVLLEDDVERELSLQVEHRHVVLDGNLQDGDRIALPFFFFFLSKLEDVHCAKSSYTN